MADHIGWKSGHEKGDTLIRAVASVIEQTLHAQLYQPSASLGY